MERTTDILVIGGGAAGLLAAAASAESGFDVVLAESTDLLGGSTASDAGQLWLPGAHAKPGAAPDAEVRRYLDAVLPAPTASSSADRRDAFVRESPAVGAWLATHGINLTAARNRPDYHPSADGAASRGGRVFLPQPVGVRTLGAWAARLRPTEYTVEYSPRSLAGLVSAVTTLGSSLSLPGRRRVSAGAALAAGLLHAAADAGVELMINTALGDLLIDPDGDVVGARLHRGSETLTITARRGVVLACGGFEGNQWLREQHLPRPTEASWTTGVADNDGRGLLAGVKAGGTLENMDDAWWTLVSLFDGNAYRMTSERSVPHGIIVDRAGDRFLDEASPLPETARRPYEHHRGSWAIPSFLVVDNAHRQRYRMGPLLPGSAVPDDAPLVSASSLAELARELDMDQAGLIGTVAAFNGAAAKGRDPDFRRGASATDRAMGDPTRRNPNLGRLGRPPFWAAPLYPGDAGTKGGLVVDAASRVLRSDGTPVAGLFATAGTAASLFPRTAPGPGAGLSSALVDAWSAVRQMRSGAGRDTGGAGTQND